MFVFPSLARADILCNVSEWITSLRTVYTTWRSRTRLTTATTVSSSAVWKREARVESYTRSPLSSPYSWHPQDPTFHLPQPLSQPLKASHWTWLAQAWAGHPHPRSTGLIRGPMWDKPWTPLWFVGRTRMNRPGRFWPWFQPKLMTEPHTNASFGTEHSDKNKNWSLRRNLTLIVSKNPQYPSKFI